MNDELHEKETVRLVGKQAQQRSLLHAYLKDRGFTSEDDFYFLDRPDKPQPWQSISLITVDIFLNGEAVYETEEDINESESSFWDELDVSYLLASLPVEYVKIFCEEVSALCIGFDLQCKHGGEILDYTSLLERFQRIVTELSESFGEPGSEDLAILIQEMYPR